MIGAIYGDVAGSVYEFDNVKTKKFELFGRDCRFTDDTVMSVAVADTLLKYDGLSDYEAFKEDLIDAMHRYGKQYPHSGYGGRFGLWLLCKERTPYNSFGNGSAMRVSPAGWYADTIEDTIALATATAEITHSHPEGIKGAVVTAGAIFLARNGVSREDIRSFIEKYYDIDFTLDEIRPTYRFWEICQESVPQAMVAFLESESFEDTIRNAISIGGDSDTIAAIAGSVAEAYYGMTEAEEKKALSYLDHRMLSVVNAFHEKYVAGRR